MVGTYASPGFMVPAACRLIASQTVARPLRSMTVHSIDSLAKQLETTATAIIDFLIRFGADLTLGIVTTVINPV